MAGASPCVMASVPASSADAGSVAPSSGPASCRVEGTRGSPSGVDPAGSPGVSAPGTSAKASDESASDSGSDVDADSAADSDSDSAVDSDSGSDDQSSRSVPIPNPPPSWLCHHAATSTTSTAATA